MNDFSEVEAVYKKLAMGPYAYLAETGWKALVKRYQWAVVSVLAFMALLLLHSIRAQALVRKRTEELRTAQMAEKTERERAYIMERAGIVSGLCSMLVHEVRQPLSALVAYAGGLKMVLKGRTVADPIVSEAAENILTQAHRVGDIVEHVRSYARQKERRGEPLSVGDLMHRAAKNFLSSSAGESIELRQNDGGIGNETLCVEPLEAELALVNLLKNAAQAEKESAEKTKLQVDFSAAMEEAMFVFRVRDYGPVCTTEAIEKLSSEARPVRKEGLGIGLFLVKRIAESHGGSLRFQLAPDHGVVAELRLPRGLEC